MFGTTKDPYEATFILPDGDMLKSEGVLDYSHKGHTQIHRCMSGDKARKYEDVDSFMVETGSIYLNWEPENASILIHPRAPDPTEAQMRVTWRQLNEAEEGSWAIGAYSKSLYCRGDYVDKYPSARAIVDDLHRCRKELGLE
jgi:hypothetical protein